VVTNTQLTAQLGSQASPRTKSIAAPRVVTAVVDKAIGATVTSAHQMLTRSQIRLQLEDIVNRNRRTTQTHVTDLEQALAVMEVNTLPEMVHAIFDKESKQFLKYRKLLMHPKYKEVLSHSLANEFRWLAQGVGNRIQGTNTFFSFTSTEFLSVV
jgi:hypothetical protein